MAELKALSNDLSNKLGSRVLSLELANQELTLEVSADSLLEVCQLLKTDPDFHFEQLMDVCGVDYLEYGVSEWTTASATTQGFSRGVIETPENPMHIEDETSSDITIPPSSSPLSKGVGASSSSPLSKGGISGGISGRISRFAVVYHLLSIQNN